MSDKCKKYIDTDEVNKENTEKGLIMFCFYSMMDLMHIMFKNERTT